jgi:arylsulfatase A-like enzyme
MNTLLITVDALRADHLDQYGYARDTMPVLDQLTKEGTLFENAFANGTYTRVSVPSFQTSNYLSYENLGTFPRVASVLESAGVSTTVIGTQSGIGLVHGDFGYGETIDLGRDEYYEEANAERPLQELLLYRANKVATFISKRLQRHGAKKVYKLLKRPYQALYPETPFEHSGYTSAKEVTNRVIDWFEEEPRDEFFLWVHYMEAHRPYGVHDPSPQYLDEPVGRERIGELMETAGTEPAEISDDERNLMIDLYDSDIRFCSQHMTRLFDYMRTEGIWETTNIIFSSDHGEEFGEHGKYFHRNYPYDELISVPLIVKQASERAEEHVVDQRQLLDLAPTICKFHGIDTAGKGFQGRSIFEGGSREVVALGQPDDRDPAVALRYDGWKYINTDADVELYDLKEDPEEQQDVADDYPSKVTELEEKVPSELFGRAVEEPREPEDEVDRKQLEALGYMELHDDE